MAHSTYFNGALYKRMSDDLHLAGVGQRTHDGYLRAVRQLADYCETSPDQIREDQLREFFLHLILLSEAHAERKCRLLHKLVSLAALRLRMAN